MSKFKFKLTPGKATSLITTGKYCDRDILFGATDSNFFTNQLPISTDTDGTIYNGTGYKYGQRLSSSGTLGNQNNSYVTGFIPCKVGDIIRMRNMKYQKTTIDGSVAPGNQRITFYDSNKQPLATVSR